MKWEEIFKKYAVDTLEFIKSGKDVALTQGQLYIQELIKWEIVSNTIFAFVSVILIIITINRMKWVCVKARTFHDETDRGFTKGLTFILGSVLILVLTMSGINSTMNSVKAYVAPRVVIMEKLAKMAGDK